MDRITTAGQENVKADVPEQIVLQLDSNLLGTLVKLRHLCSLEEDGIYKASWNALTLAGITKAALVELQSRHLIGWMWNRNMQFIQVKA